VISEWDKPASIVVTGIGTLTLNYTDPDTRRRFQLDPLKCTSALPVRTTDDDIPQGDGKIPHRRWRSGYGVHLAISLVIDEGGGEFSAACDADLVAMEDELGLFVNEMIRTGLVSGYPNARYIWTPSGTSDDRMLDRCQLSGTPTLARGELDEIQYEFDLDTPYPYYMEFTETQTMLASTGLEVINNAGNTEFYPTVKIYGDPSTYVELVNYSIEDLDGNPLKLVYFSALPGAVAIPVSPQYVEFVFFTGTAFLNGSGANRLAGLDFRYSDFFPLVPGDNMVEIFGASALVLSNGAWA
jgi:hypothetical protein